MKVEVSCIQAFASHFERFGRVVDVFVVETTAMFLPSAMALCSDARES